MGGRIDEKSAAGFARAPLSRWKGRLAIALNHTKDERQRSSKSTRGQRDKERPHWWPWTVVGFLLLVLCLGWFLLPLREWIEALQSWLLGLGLWGVLIFTTILLVMTFLPAPDWPLPVAAGYVYGSWAFPLT
jgi:hypothetical protein